MNEFILLSSVQRFTAKLAVFTIFLSPMNLRVKEENDGKAKKADFKSEFCYSI
jgi:hypothetical protein